MTKTTESRWRALIADHARSGMTVREFAVRRGISPTTLYWWRSRLGRTSAADLVSVKIVERQVAEGGREGGREAAIRTPQDSSCTSTSL